MKVVLHLKNWMAWRDQTRKVIEKLSTHPELLAIRANLLKMQSNHSSKAKPVFFLQTVLKLLTKTILEYSSIPVWQRLPKIFVLFKAARLLLQIVFARFSR